MSIGFDSAISGLQAARAAIQTIGHNIANQATPGYSRQSVLLQSARPITVGGLVFGDGVVVGNITRSVDQLLLARIQTQQSAFGSYDVQYSRLSELESILQEPGPGGLGAMMSAYFGSIQQLSGDPTSNEKRVGLLVKARSLADNFNRVAGQIFSQTQDISGQLSIMIGDVNKLTSRIATLNEQILSFEGGTTLRANDLRDQRDDSLQKLGELVSLNASEDPNGAVRVQIGGYLLVSNVTSTQVSLGFDEEDLPQVEVAGSGQVISIERGQVGGLISLVRSGKASNLLAGINDVARNFILETNRLHSTGVPKSGSFTSMLSFYSPTDTNSNGNFADETLDNEGFPFSVQNGRVYINVVNQSTGDMSKHYFEVDAGSDTLQSIANKISAIPNLGASVDATGRLLITSLGGYAFDFSARMDKNPNSGNTFGAASATVSSGSQGPFSLANGDTMTISVDGGAAQTITVNTADFADITNATAEEVADAINADLVGATARVVNGRLVINSDNSDPAASSIDINDGAGTLAADLDLSTTARSGAAVGVNVEILGSYNGSDNDVFTFVPDSDGTIGSGTLTVGVFDSGGNRIRTLEVGANYTPGDALTVADGVQVKFTVGDLSSTAGDFFDLDVVADSDSADLLPALGLNSLFYGRDASDIELNATIENNSDLVSGSFNGDPADNGTFLTLLGLQSKVLEELDGRSLTDAYGNTIGQLGFDVSNAEQLLDSQLFLVENLEVQRQSVSGVSVDEELTRLLQFQQMFEAISRYISVISDLERNLVSTL